MRRVFTLSLVILLAGLFGMICQQMPVMADVHYVDGYHADDTGDGLSWANAEKTIGAAITAATSGDEIWVRGKGDCNSEQFSGIYVERITLKSGVKLYGGFYGNEETRTDRASTPFVEIPYETVIDGSAGGSVVTVPASASNTTTIDGFTIRNGSATNGGGVNCGASSCPQISHNRIEFNTVSSAGAGIYSSTAGTYPIYVFYNVIQHNYGSAVSCTYAFVKSNIIRGNRYGVAAGYSVMNNFISGNGGTVLASGSGSIWHNTIVGSGYPGGAINVSSGSPSIRNNIVAYNHSGIVVTGGTPTLLNNCVCGNMRYDYSGVSAGQGDISPEDGPGLGSVEYGELHIQPGSPCIDAGIYVCSSDIDGDVRTNGQPVDIGADEAPASDPPTWSSAPPVTIMVDAGRPNDDGDGLTWTTAKKTIQAGIDAAAVKSGEVWVRGGTDYVERITLRAHVHVYGGFAHSEDARWKRNCRANPTTIDGDAGGSVVSALVGHLVSTLDGFTVTGGSATNGGGIYCDVASPHILNNIITGNQATNNGGGIYAYYTSPDICGNVITSNSSGSASGYGGGVFCTLVGHATIANNVIADNSTAGGGGGIYLAPHFSAAMPKVVNNTIVGNTCGANNGAGLYVKGIGQPNVSNNIIASNGGATYGYGIYVYTGTSATPLLTCNNVCDNLPGNYCNITAGTSDISITPTFVQYDERYHLEGPGYSDVCVDVGWDQAPGLPTTDMDGGPRALDGGYGLTPDIGADERESNPPVASVVTDQGAWIMHTPHTPTWGATTLRAWWQTESPGSIQEYQWVLSTSSDSDGIEEEDWQSAGIDTHIEVSDNNDTLEFSPGETYYFHVRARNYATPPSGVWGAVGVSDGITILDSDQVCPPVFSPGGGDYCDTCKHVKLTCDTPDSVIYYKHGTAGSDPGPADQDSHLYDDDSVVFVHFGDAPQTMRAKAYASGLDDSTTVSHTYTHDCSGGGSSPSYTCWRLWPSLAKPPVITGLRVSDVCLHPKAMVMQWAPSYTDVRYEVRRYDGTQWTTLTPTADPAGQIESYYSDTFDFTLASDYQYAVKGLAGQESPPAGLSACTHNPGESHTCLYLPHWLAGDEQIIRATPDEVIVDANQAVDSRQDTRCVQPATVNFQFGERTYRGGLFVGNADDPSRIGRSFLRFDFSDLHGLLATNERLWTGNLETYYVRSFDSGMETHVGWQPLSDDAEMWDQQTIVWDTAPTLDPADAVEVQHVGGATPAWYRWTRVFPDMLREFYTDDVLSMGFASEDEQTAGSGWAYFAKSQYDATLGPRIAVAYGGYSATGAPIFPVAVDIDPASVVGGNAVTCTVTLNSPAPSGGIDVDLGCRGCYTYGPTTLHFAEDQMSGTFTVYTSEVQTNVNVEISAGTSPLSASGTLTITIAE